MRHDALIQPLSLIKVNFSLIKGIHIRNNATYVIELMTPNLVRTRNKFKEWQYYQNSNNLLFEY